jgi:hypothetical protein
MAADRRRSGVVEARLLRALGMRTCGSTSSVSPWRTQEARKESGGANPSPVATSSQRRRGTEEAAKVEGLLELACLQSEGKGGSRSSGSSLNSSQERRRRGEAEAFGGGRRLPLMAAAFSGRGLRKG